MKTRTERRACSVAWAAGMCAVLGAATALWGEFGPFNGPVGFPGGGMVIEGENPGMPIQPQVQQILSSIRAGNPKSRDLAEQKLVNLGANGLATLKSQIGGQKGLARDALAVAVFRVENAPLAPDELLTAWASKKADAAPASFATHRVAADELWKLFPHHLFYAVELNAGATAKAAFPRTVVALAADGKVQPIGDDESLAKFLKHELTARTSEKECRRAAGGAAVLALARSIPANVEMPGAELVWDGKAEGTGFIGTASIRGGNVRPVSVALQMDAQGRVVSLATTQSAETPPSPEATSTAPAATSTAPASRPARPRLPRPQIRGGPEPFDPGDGR